MVAHLPHLLKDQIENLRLKNKTKTPKVAWHCDPVVEYLSGIHKAPDFNP